LNYKVLKRAQEIRRQLRRMLIRFKIPIISAGDDSVAIRKCIVSGYFANAAQLQSSGYYRSVRGNQELHIHPSSVCHRDAPKWIVFHEVVHTSKNYMR
jgi:ATP-dependent RNA helicase DDX35